MQSEQRSVKKAFILIYLKIPKIFLKYIKYNISNNENTHSGCSSKAKGLGEWLLWGFIHPRHIPICGREKKNAK